MPSSAKPRRKYRALPTEAPIVEHAIGLLDRIWSTLKLSKPVITVGEGQRRARERAAAHRKAQAARLVDAAAPAVTRQQVRRHKILRERQAVTMAKREARHRKLPGGGAQIRAVSDIDAVLG